MHACIVTEDNMFVTIFCNLMSSKSNTMGTEQLLEVHLLNTILQLEKLF